MNPITDLWENRSRTGVRVTRPLSPLTALPHPHRHRHPHPHPRRIYRSRRSAAPLGRSGSALQCYYQRQQYGRASRENMRV